MRGHGLHVASALADLKGRNPEIAAVADLPARDRIHHLHRKIREKLRGGGSRSAFSVAASSAKLYQRARGFDLEVARSGPPQRFQKSAAAEHRAGLASDAAHIRACLEQCTRTSASQPSIRRISSE